MPHLAAQNLFCCFRQTKEALQAPVLGRLLGNGKVLPQMSMHDVQALLILLFQVSVANTTSVKGTF
jgi:hypothetical protein